MKSNLILTTFVCLMLPVMAYATSNKCAAPDVTTVHAVKKHAHDDQYVVLIGKVSHHDGAYVLNDGTGRIKLDTSKKLPVGKNIVVRGHYDKADFLGIGSNEIDVKSWRYTQE